MRGRTTLCHVRLRAILWGWAGLGMIYARPPRVPPPVLYAQPIDVVTSIRRELQNATEADFGIPRPRNGMPALETNTEA